MGFSWSASWRGSSNSTFSWTQIEIEQGKRLFKSYCVWLWSIQVTNLTECSPIEFLLPFLEVIQCEDLEGPITGLALSTVNKFLSYGLIDVDHHEAGVIVERLAQSVTHARFRGTNPANDEVVLMKIIMVLRTLILTPIGQLLTNETVRRVFKTS